MAVGAYHSGLVVAFVVQFFRDPPRTAPSDRTPLSRRRTAASCCRESADPYLDRDALKISVFMNVFNAHSNRSPVDGVVRNTWYHAGSFVNASLPRPLSRTSVRRCG